MSLRKKENFGEKFIGISDYEEAAKKYALKAWTTICSGLIWIEAEFVSLEKTGEDFKHVCFRVVINEKEFSTGKESDKKGSFVKEIRRSCFITVDKKKCKVTDMGVIR